MTNGFTGFRHHQIILIWFLDDPPVVNVLERVTSDLLLMGTAPTIRIPQRIHVIVTVQPTGPAVCVSKSDLRTMRHLQRLSLRDAGESSLQTRLERAGHHRIVWPRLIEYRQVYVEYAQIHNGNNADQHGESYKEMDPQNRARQCLPRKQRPVITRDQEERENYGIKRDVFHAVKKNFDRVNLMENNREKQ